MPDKPKTKVKIKSVIFDLGGVIMHGGYLDFVHHYCAACMTPAGKKQILNLERQVNLGTITEKEFYNKIRDVFGVQLTPKQMHKTIVDKMQPDKKLLAFIPKLSKAKIVLFTNSIGYMAREVLKKRHLTAKRIFDRTFFSNIMHIAKPDGSAYVKVLKSLKVRPAQALMVDDRAGNIRAARKLGMRGIVYRNFAQFKKEIRKYELQRSPSRR